MQFLTGFLLGTLVALLAWRARALSISGAVAAALTGGMIFGLGGLPWAALLLTFFITSSGFSRLFQRRKTGLGEKFSKGNQRDYAQVLANGGLGAGLALLHALAPDQDIWWIAFGGAMAAVNADTWATELGVLSASLPRLITTGKVTERGTSGAVTWLGYGAILGGSGLVAAVGAVFKTPVEPLGYILCILLGGLAGSTFDSLLGATVQAIYTCPTCQKETERHPYHSCGSTTTLQRGWQWLNNDWVNFGCSLIGAGVAGGLWACCLR
jgi:uncharacterized protein (TIGR00297 family)